MSVPSELERLDSCRKAVMPYLRWLGVAQPGWSRQYHYGHLGSDREQDLTTRLIGKLFARASALGLVELSQRASTPNSGNACVYYARRLAGKLTADQQAQLVAALIEGEK